MLYPEGILKERMEGPVLKKVSDHRTVIMADLSKIELVCFMKPVIIYQNFVLWGSCPFVLRDRAFPFSPQNLR